MAGGHESSQARARFSWLDHSVRLDRLRMFGLDGLFIAGSLAFMVNFWPYWKADAVILGMLKAAALPHVGLLV
jgi:hypothetical protein